LLLDRLHGARSLSPLDIAEVGPHELEDEAGLFAGTVPKHVDEIVAWSADVAHSQHHALETKQQRRHTIAPRLRHRHIQLVVARPRRERACDRAAFAIEETRSPREVGSSKCRSESIQEISRSGATQARNRTDSR